MSLTMPIINLRRKKSSHQRGNRNRLLLRSKVAKAPPKTRKIKSAGCDDVILPIKNGEHSESHSGGSKKCKQETKSGDLYVKSEDPPSQAPPVDKRTATDRLECTEDEKAVVVQQEERVTGTSSTGGPISSIIRSHTSLVQGSTLGCIMQRIHFNDGDVSEIDFSTLAQYNKRLGPEGCALVARSMATNHTVRKLVIRDHAIGDDGAIALSRMLCNNTTLKSLELYGNSISDRGGEALAQALYGHDSLAQLCLKNNLITDRGAEALAKAIRCNCSLKSLHLVQNRITWKGAQILLDALDVNLHLETITMDANDMPTFIESQFAATLARNRAESLMHESYVAKERADKLVRRASGCTTEDEDEDSSEEKDLEDYGNDSTDGICSTFEIPVSSWV
ncbi:hypothetical protein PsorP6_004320 [Peronosclerospora sorghi]|uniref:Uncharacterized protein n=1 Tax=Peronosclerospora sorghi TaxID=230839 RepID=A0ACC0VLC7_9STRA|nr:hypothetical protein PsorP6_004320 [Peronosclerospora sorghi]